MEGAGGDDVHCGYCLQQLQVSHSTTPSQYQCNTNAILSKNIVNTICMYGQKFWREINFGGLAVLRAIRQYFHPTNFLQYDIIVRLYVTASICRPLSFKMSARKLQTLKEWNENSPDLVYHQLVPASFDVLYVVRNRPSSVYTTNRSGVLH